MIDCMSVYRRISKTQFYLFDGMFVVRCCFMECNPAGFVAFVSAERSELIVVGSSGPIVQLL